MSPEDYGRFGDYCQYRRSEEAECTRLRMGLSDDDARQYEAAYQHSQEGRAAA